MESVTQSDILEIITLEKHLPLVQPELIAGLLIVAFAAVAWGREVIKYKKTKQTVNEETFANK